MPLIFRGTLALVGVDSSIGKIGTSMLSQQTLMKLFIGNFTKTSEICGTGLSDIADWNGLVLDADGNVVKIFFDNIELEGEIHLKWLPSSVSRLQMNTSLLTGSVTLGDLPSQMEWVNLEDNALLGTLDLEHLPTVLRTLFLNSNRFFGTICLTKLPSSILEIDLSENQLSGPLDFTALPESMRSLMLSRNAFEGDTDFHSLPTTLWSLDLQFNENLSGTMHLQQKNSSYIVESTKVQKVYL